MTKNLAATVVSSLEDADAAISDYQSDHDKFSFIIMGGGFSDEDYNALKPKTNLLWLRPVFRSPDYTGPQPTAPLPADEVAARVKEALDKYAEDIRAGKGAGEVWYF